MSFDPSLPFPKAQCTSFRPCFLVPCYNHGAQFAAALPALLSFHYHIFVSDDFSATETREILREIAARYPGQITLLHHTVNQGKGGAVITAMREAGKRHFTHAIQLDADGQHDLAYLPSLLAAAIENPTALVSGHPIYDTSVPRSRFYARYLTHSFVWLETLSFKIKDSMCGFRVYPVASTLELLDRCRIGTRMDFDVEIMVRLFWGGVPVHFIPVKVVYPENNCSHFHLLHDNLRIFWMHTRLSCMLPFHLFKSLVRRLRCASSGNL
ncbi:MAG: glycosyltransferase family 2 protein [Puniceicoccales bacterium]|jgi:glycosyltransferase involved in cell wall biosynthesis|nr:glycosyltransferase family 2 protein [Puniceicoccales bacterium]